MITSRATAVLQPGRDIHIIACERPSPTGAPELAAARSPASGRCIGLRWASDADLRFPPSGYLISRRTEGAEPGPGLEGGTATTFWLPASDSWPSFQRAAEARRPACGGPYFASIQQADLGHLLPLIRLADPRTSTAELPGLTTNAADFFGNPHRSDAELAYTLWRFRPPTIAEALADSVAAPRVIDFYRGRATEFLLVLALRFEYAALLGLGTDDTRAPAGTVVYDVQATWGDVTGTSTSDPVPDNRSCAPGPPAWARAERTPGTVAHPGFAVWPGWVPPPELAPVDGSGQPLPPEATVPRAPAAFTALSWAGPDPDPHLIGYGPVLYRVGRHEHGAATAGTVSTPPVPPGAVFTPLMQGNDLMRGDTEPNLLDLPGMRWPPLEGHYHYEVSGVDLLGTQTATATRTSVRHHDDIAPPAPRAAALVGPVVTLDANATSLDVPLRIDWDSLEDFAGPDAVEFRVAVQWTPLIAISLHLRSVADVDLLHADVSVDDLPGKRDQYVGARLSLPGAEYPIVANGTGTPAVLRVRKIGTQMPDGNTDGLIYAAGSTTAITRLAKLSRRVCVPATVTAVSSATPIEIELAAAATAPLVTDTSVRIYLHLLRATFDAQFAGGQRWRIQAPAPGTPASQVWERWQDLRDAAGTMTRSPAIVFPPHVLKVSLIPPTGFTAGLVSLFVTAADGAGYVSSPALPVSDPSLAAPRGNESARTEVILSVRSLQPPGTVSVAGWDPNRRLWATSAANYAEEALFDVRWTAATGAVRYEVWRALEGAISGSAPTTSDGNLRSLASGDARAFELRSDQVFGSHYQDSLPGRAPTRALYRVRGISAGGIPGAWSDLVGPVYVPDVRQPPAPNLLRAAAPSPAEADRAIVLEWTQAGPVDNVRFDVHFRPADAPDSAAWARAGFLPVGTAPGAVGRYRFVHGELTPGKQFSYRVMAVRVAADPIDPAAAATRDIASQPSAIQTAFAISTSPLAPPVSLAGVYSAATGSVTLTWTNRDDYESIEVWRKAADRYSYRAVSSTLPGSAQTFTDASVPSGTWSYQVRAAGIMRQATSAIDAQVQVP